jgi:hypothetical protein
MTAEDVINVRVAFLTGNTAPPTGLSPHPDTVGSFPYRVEPVPGRACSRRNAVIRAGADERA